MNNNDLLVTLLIRPQNSLQFFTMSSDWDSVTIIKKRPTTQKSLKSTSSINQALRSGGTVVSEKKTGLNAATTTIGSKIAKVDRQTDVIIHLYRKEYLN